MTGNDGKSFFSFLWYKRIGNLHIYAPEAMPWEIGRCARRQSTCPAKNRGEEASAGVV